MSNCGQDIKTSAPYYYYYILQRHPAALFSKLQHWQQTPPPPREWILHAKLGGVCGPLSTPPPNTQPLPSPIPNHCYLKRFVRKELYDLEYHFLDGYTARIWCGHNLPANSSSLLGERGKNGWPHVGAKGSQWQRRLWTVLYCMAGSGATILDKVN